MQADLELHSIGLFLVARMRKDGEKCEELSRARPVIFFRLGGDSPSPGLSLPQTEGSSLGQAYPRLSMPTTRLSSVNTSLFSSTWSRSLCSPFKVTLTGISFPPALEENARKALLAGGAGVLRVHGRV